MNTSADAGLCMCAPPSALGSPATSLLVGEQLLATLLRSPALLDEIPGLEIYDFDCPKHRVVFETIRNLQARGEAISVESIHDYLCALDEVRGTVCRLHGGQRYLRALLRVDATPDAARDAAHVRACAGLLRRIRVDRDIEAELAAKAKGQTT